MNASEMTVGTFWIGYIPVCIVVLAAVCKAMCTRLFLLLAQKERAELDKQLTKKIWQLIKQKKKDCNVGFTIDILPKTQ
jgi:site-specific recombinase